MSKVLRSYCRLVAIEEGFEGCVNESTDTEGVVGVELEGVKATLQVLGDPDAFAMLRDLGVLLDILTERRELIDTATFGCRGLGLVRFANWLRLIFDDRLPLGATAGGEV